MRGILRKDIACMGKNGLLYLILIVAFCAMGKGGGVTFALFYSLMIPVNAIAMDERTRFDRLERMLPVSALASVAAKYLLTYVFMGLAVLLATLSRSAAVHALAVPDMLLPALAFCLLAQAITLALIYRFGVERGRAIYMVSIVAQAAVIAAVSMLMQERVFVPTAVLNGIALVAALALNIASMLFSAQALEKRMAA